MFIPQISDKQLKLLAEQIKPLVRDERDEPRLIMGVDLRNSSYIWSPTFKGAPVLGLKTLGEFQCLHTFGHPSLFKPSVAEVLSQIPKPFLSNAAFFEIVKSPQSSEDLNKESKALEEGYHVSTVRVYSKEN